MNRDFVVGVPIISIPEHFQALCKKDSAFPTSLPVFAEGAINPFYLSVGKCPPVGVPIILDWLIPNNHRIRRLFPSKCRVLSFLPNSFKFPRSLYIHPFFPIKVILSYNPSRNTGYYRFLNISEESYAVGTIHLIR